MYLDIHEVTLYSYTTIQPISRLANTSPTTYRTNIMLIGGCKSPQRVYTYKKLRRSESHYMTYGLLLGFIQHRKLISKRPKHKMQKQA